MTADQIAALAAGIPTIITAITGLVIAVKARRTANASTFTSAMTDHALTDHIVKHHNAFPIQSPTETQ
jgi:hypothetical protein